MPAQPGAYVEGGGRRGVRPVLRRHRADDVRLDLDPGVVCDHCERCGGEPHAAFHEVEPGQLFEKRSAEHRLTAAGGVGIDQVHLAQADARAHLERPVAHRIVPDLALHRKAAGQRRAQGHTRVRRRRPVHRHRVAGIAQHRTAMARDNRADPGKDRVDDLLQRLGAALRGRHRLGTHAREPRQIADQHHPRRGMACRPVPGLGRQQMSSGLGHQRISLFAIEPGRGL